MASGDQRHLAWLEFQPGVGSNSKIVHRRGRNPQRQRTIARFDNVIPVLAQKSALQDDDSGGNCNARLTASFPQAGDYEIVVNSAGAKYATGTFSLSVTSGSKPKSVARCSRSQ